MGKASSAKKVARAARAGGKVTGQRRNLGFPAAIVAIVVLGVGLVTFARGGTTGDGAPTLQDHWHSAFGIYVCDRWVANTADVAGDALGIHSHGDGLVHVHPFVAGATGDEATIDKFYDAVGLKVSDNSVTLPSGNEFGERQYTNGQTTCGGKKGRWVMAHWNDATKADGKPDDIRTTGFTNVRFDEDKSAYTLAFLPEDETATAPPSAADIVNLGSADGGGGQPVTGQPDGSERPDDTSTDGSSDTTVPGDTSVPGGTGSTDSAPASTEAPSSTQAGG